MTMAFDIALCCAAMTALRRAATAGTWLARADRRVVRGVARKKKHATGNILYLQRFEELIRLMRTGGHERLPELRLLREGEELRRRMETSGDLEPASCAGERMSVSWLSRICGEGPVALRPQPDCRQAARPSR